MKKQLEVQGAYPQEKISMAEWSVIMDQYPYHAINNSPWPAFRYRPEAAFSITHTDNAILLKYYVQEKEVKAACSQPNDLVYKDSCVEFFISFNEGDSYYNLEFNCIGTCYVGYGYAGKERNSLPVELIKTIDYYASFQPSASEQPLIVWSLTLKIPLTVFTHDRVQSLKGSHAQANFYKCGDDLSSPHYLTWNNIVASQPNFHLPQFFGELIFK